MLFDNYVMPTIEKTITESLTEKLCFPVTEGLKKAWRLQKERRSTEYTYLVLNNCICGKCINKKIDFSE